VALGEITNTVGQRPAEISKKWASTETYAPEVQALSDCASRLEEVWVEARSRNSCGYLFRQYSQLALVQPCRGELPSFDVLQAAWMPDTDSDEEKPTPFWEKVPKRQDMFSAFDGKLQPKDDFPIFQDELLSEAEVAVYPDKSTGCSNFDSYSSPATPQRTHKAIWVPQSPASSPKKGDFPLSPIVGPSLAQPACFPDVSSDSDGELSVWNDKELCEKELEHRLMSMLQQEQEESWLLEQQTAATFELARSLNSGSLQRDATPPCSPSMYRTPRRRQAAPQARASSDVRSRDVHFPAEADRIPEAGLALEDMTANLLTTLQQTAERHRPAASSVVEHLGAQERVLAADWLLETCFAMHFQEVVSFAAVACLDRYISLLPSPLPVSDIQALVLATISLALKLHGMSQVSASLREVLVHLGQSTVPIESIVFRERKVLETLQFEVSTPTLIEMLGLVANRCQAIARQDCCCEFCRLCQDEFVWQLAELLLHLALREVHLLYAYPSSILVVAATLLAWGRADAKPCPKQLRVLLRCVRASVQPPSCPTPGLAVDAGTSHGSRFHHRI